MEKPTEEEIQKAINTLVRGMLYPITTQNVLLIKDGYLQLGNEQMQGQEIGVLATECKLIQDTRIWAIMQENIRFEAFKLMSEATTTEGMMPGKWMLYNLNSQKGVMDTILKAGEKIGSPLKKVSQK